MPQEIKTSQLEKDVQELKTTYAVTQTEIGHIKQSINEIKNNHLLHINDKLATLDTNLVNNNIELTKLVNDKLGEIYKKITELTITDAKQEPTQNIISEVIKYIIIAVVGAGIALLLSHV